ncbi:MAG: zinc-binding dehydrogenase [Alphaproteobacteria bacterium]|nr:zinc-binding dehydrogenase [Alphaproteobacteria bacterium]MBF0391188.1 zinc-binding dehydrogenase [Alphaproteobacteria bacterium]
MDIPRDMKAAILVEQRQPLVIGEIALPSTLDVGQVMVRVHFSGICGSQLGEIDGAKGPDKFLPHLLGHEGSGTVLAIGPGVRHVAPGDKVVLHWRKGLGIECAPPAYSWEGRKVNAGWVTTFNEYAIVAENRLTRIPPDSDLEVAALFGCAVTTGFGVVVNNARLTIGESVVVYGAGGVGLNIVQAAALVSAWPIIAVDLHDNRLALAGRMGATHLINAKTEDAPARIAEILGGQTDVFIDNTGNPEIIQLGYAIAKPQGRVVLVGVPKKGADIRIHSLQLHFGKVLTGSHGGEAVPEIDIPRYQTLHERGRLRLDELITRRCGLDGINDAIAGMRDGSIAGRCMVAL